MSGLIDEENEVKNIEISSLDADEIFEEVFSGSELKENVEVPFEVKDEVKIKKTALKKYSKIQNLTVKKGRSSKVSKVGRIIEVRENGILKVDFWDSKPARVPVSFEDLEIVSRYKDREEVAAKNVPKKEVVSPPKGVNNTEANAKPSRYNQGTIEVWDAIEGMNLGYLEGNVVKYVARHQHKNGNEDLLKALNYLIKIIANNNKKDYYILRELPIDQLASFLTEEA